MKDKFEGYLKRVLQCSLVKPPEEMLGECLGICIDLSGATGGSILGEEGPHLQFLFSNVPELIGMNVPWNSIAGTTTDQSLVIYTFAPSDKRHFDGVDGKIQHQTRYLLSIPIPSVHSASANADRAKSVGALQLLFDENIFPEIDVSAGAQEFSLESMREQDSYEEMLRDVMWILPNISFGMEVMRLRQTSYQVIHELKNKLIAARSWLNCLQEDLEEIDPALFENEDIAEDFELAASAAHQGSKLAVGYLQFTKIYTPQCVEANINDVLKKTSSDIKAFAADRGGTVQVVVEPADDVPLRELDPDQLQMAFFNLGKNAVEALVEFEVENAAVTLKSEVLDKRLRITVADNGPGMPEEIANNLFVAFKTKKEGGTGLGLTITKKIVDVHGGTIRCQTGSTGTSFVIEM